MIGTIKDAVGQAMDEMRLEVAAGITELVTEIRGGGETVARALRAEAAGVRAELSEIVGNAQAAADDAVTSARKVAAEGNGHDGRQRQVKQT